MHDWGCFNPLAKNKGEPMAAPYEQTYAAGGERYFDASLPAWSKIGERFEELSQAYYDFEYPPEHFQKGRELLAAIRQGQAKLEKSPQSWATVDKELTDQFGQPYLDAKGHLLAPLAEYFTTGQMPAGEYMEWMALEVESRMAAQGDPQADWDAIEAQRAELTGRLTSAGYATERDRQMQAEDPARYTFLQNSLQLLSQQMQNPDDASGFEQMMAEQMKLFQQSPFFAQAQNQMDEMVQGLEALKDSDPELYQQQREQIEAVSELYRDPAAAMKNLMAGMGEMPGENEGEDESDMPALPHGSLRFACGQKKVTPAQRKLFEQLQRDQQSLLPQIEQALRDLHARMNPGQKDDPREDVLFPPDPAHSDVPLNAFAIERVELDRDGRYAILWLDTLFPHFDEHACGIRIENGTVTRYGSWDEVCDEPLDDMDE
jgi:hypothetical protein